MKKFYQSLIIGLFVFVLMLLSGCSLFQHTPEESQGNLEIVAKIISRNLGYNLRHSYPAMAIAIKIVCEEVIAESEGNAGFFKIATNKIIEILLPGIDDMMLALDIKDILQILTVDINLDNCLTHNQIRVVKSVAQGFLEGINCDE